MFPYIHFLGRDIGSYGLCIVIAVTLVVILALRKGKSNGLIIEDLLIVGACALGFALIGGSLLYVFITYSPAQIGEFIRLGDLSFLGSGIVFYGGLIGGMMGALIGIRIAKCKFALIERSVVPFIPLGHAIGRVGCVLAGCCYGYAYSGPFALYYSNSVSGLSPEQGCFPVQLLESLVNIGICIFLLWCEKKIKRASVLLFIYLGMYAISRFFLEMFRGDAVRGIWTSLSTSQIISVLLLCVSVVGLIWGKKNRIQCT